MQSLRHASVALVVPVTLLLAAGCASVPKKPSEASVVFDKPAAVVQKAAVDSLIVSGFDIEKTEPLYVQGFRQHRVGVVVGSGGETVGVWLEPMGDSRTGVRVDTAKSFVGIAGQRNWDEDILKEMSKSLGRRE